MAVYGAFDAICSLVAGRLTSVLRSITFIVCTGAFFQAVIFIWLSLKYSATGGVLAVVYPLLMAALLGIGDGVLNTQLSALLALLFKHMARSAVMNFKIHDHARLFLIRTGRCIFTAQGVAEFGHCICLLFKHGCYVADIGDDYACCNLCFLGPIFVPHSKGREGIL
ncbi:UNC93-like protein 3 [Hibiscus syriacus]|nr:UNC93-like protein 3 [Hibiscus syriacus]